MEKNSKKASILSKRISAYLIDILFIFLVIGLISEIKFINPTYNKYVEAYEQYSTILEDYSEDKISNKEFENLYNKNYYLVSKYSVSYNAVIVVSILLYFGVFQKYNNGQTIGKKLMKIRVTSNDKDKKVSLGNYLLRTLPMFYIYVGGVIPLIINSILVFIVKNNTFMNLSMIVSYIFLFISIITFTMLCVRKDERGLHDLLAKTKVEYIEK